MPPGTRQIETLRALFKAAPTGLSPSQLSQRIGIDVRNVHSVLHALIEKGWASKAPGPVYVITVQGEYRVMAEGGLGQAS